MFDNMLVELTFANRGYPADYLTRISKAEHKVLANTELFIRRLRDLYETQQKIVILPDFDMDGISAGVVGFAGLAELGFNVALFLPDPTEGYGFSPETIVRLHNDYPDVRAIITCDVGITCFDGISLARSLGIEVLLTDHHTPDAKCLPDTDCIVNPMCEDEEGYTHKFICGAYVLYQLLESYVSRYCSRQMVEQIKRLRVFAGMGTISDSMPLLYENRRLVQDALSIAKLVYASGSDFVVNHMFGCDIYRRAFRGLYLVLKAFEVTGRIKKQDDITSTFFAYYVAPMFNSVKRLGKSDDMNNAFGVFFGADPQASVDYLMKLNDERKVEVTNYFNKLQQDAQPYAPFVYFSDAPAGILGLLAQKQVEYTGKPCCVVTANGEDSPGSFHGSGRSVPWYPLKSRACERGFYLAGHDVAFGCGFKNVTDIRRFCDFVSGDLAVIESCTDLTQFEAKPDFVIAHDGTGDTVIDIVLFMDYIDEIERLGPFGSGFSAPRVLLKFKASDGIWELMGSTKQHLKITLDYGLKVVLFNQANRISMAESDETCYVMGHLIINEFREIKTVQFMGDFVEI